MGALTLFARQHDALTPSLPHDGTSMLCHADAPSIFTTLIMGMLGSDLRPKSAHLRSLFIVEMTSDWRGGVRCRTSLRAPGSGEAGTSEEDEYACWIVYRIVYHSVFRDSGDVLHWHIAFPSKRVPGQPPHGLLYSVDGISRSLRAGCLTNAIKVW